MNKLRLSARLGLAFSLVLMLVLAMAGLGIVQLQRISNLNNAQAATSESLMLARQWVFETEINLARGMVLAKGGNSSAITDMLAGPMKASSDKIGGYAASLDKVLTAEDERKLLASALEQRKSYTAVRQGLLQRLKQGDVAGVEEDADKLLVPAGAAYMAAVSGLGARLGDLVASQGAEQDLASHQAILMLATLAGLAVAAGALLSWLITRSIVTPVREAIQSSTRVAEGDLTQTITSQRGDELGDLLRSLGAMQQSLRSLVGDVRLATDNIGTASAEIRTGNADLSARTEQTASNLQQTASSMEQLTGTVRQTADSARTANQLAATAAETARRGGQVVSDVVLNMQEINTSSRKISDIIGVIDGIAFQTNILALNAAVEAARAGEQGRGFAVVATEVRSLAQRSATAAREIKALIGASVERVESGALLVASAGSTMQDIVGSVQRVSDIIGEITAAAAEQSDGIHQVNGAVAQLDQMTQQNAALVEQSAAAAESLKDQADGLSQVVSRFQLDGRAPTAAPAAQARPTADPTPARPVPAPSRAANIRKTERPAAQHPPAAPPQTARPAAPVASDSDWESF